MKIKFLRINPLLLILLSITCFHSNAIASLNPLNWFSSKDDTSQVIKIENDNEKGTKQLVKKLAKSKAKGNEKAQQKIYKKILRNHPRASIAKEAAYNRGVFTFSTKQNGKILFRHSVSLNNIIQNFHNLMKSLNYNFNVPKT